ncbi:hypothetical protein CAEBREN_31549 [Caenorhabditis brenneri]|uniref:Uncharacterized protein n=1 Tax=Caenorhabditis brenneri TaxID=135651 RepID=G0PGJ2_CAEBE|nr:hypothetical protein CAEBREN_31549 [Caenorhabditis brenneri]
MVGLKLTALGFLVFAVFVLEVVAVFTPAWFTWQEVSRSGIVSVYNKGIVPYYSNEDTWLAVSSILLFASLALTTINVFLFIGAYFSVKSQGYSRQVIVLLHALAISSVAVIVFNGTAFILMATNINKQYLLLSFGYPVQFGYSAWFCLSAVVVTFGSVLLAEYIVSKKEEEKEDEAPVESAVPPRILTSSFTNMY